MQGEHVVLKHLFFPTGQVCPLPPMVSHGDFICHPRPCDRYNHGTVVEFYCDPGYGLTSDYKYITCQYGEWFPSYQVYCIKSGKLGPRPAGGAGVHPQGCLEACRRSREPAGGGVRRRSTGMLPNKGRGVWGGAFGSHRGDV